MSTVRFISEVSSGSLVLVDTSFVMDDSFPNFAEELREDHDGDLCMTLLSNVVRELREQVNGDDSRKVALAMEGSRALQTLISEQIAVIEEDHPQPDRHADAPINSMAQLTRTERDVHVLTNDVALMKDVTDLNNQMSVKSRYKVYAWKLHGSSGEIVRFRNNKLRDESQVVRETRLVVRRDNTMSDHRFERKRKKKKRKKNKYPRVVTYVGDHHSSRIWIGEAVKAVCGLLALVIVLGFVWWTNPLKFFDVESATEIEFAGRDEQVGPTTDQMLQLIEQWKQASSDFERKIIEQQVPNHEQKDKQALTGVQKIEYSFHREVARLKAVENATRISANFSDKSPEERQQVITAVKAQFEHLDDSGLVAELEQQQNRRLDEEQSAAQSALLTAKAQGALGEASRNYPIQILREFCSAQAEGCGRVGRGRHLTEIEALRLFAYLILHKRTISDAQKRGIDIDSYMDVVHPRSPAGLQGLVYSFRHFQRAARFDFQSRQESGKEAETFIANQRYQLSADSDPANSPEDWTAKFIKHFRDELSRQPEML